MPRGTGSREYWKNHPRKIVRKWACCNRCSRLAIPGSTHAEPVPSGRLWSVKYFFTSISTRGYLNEPVTFSNDASIRCPSVAKEGVVASVVRQRHLGTMQDQIAPATSAKSGKVGSMGLVILIVVPRYVRFADRSGLSWYP